MHTALQRIRDRITLFAIAAIILGIGVNMVFSFSPNIVTPLEAEILTFTGLGLIVLGVLLFLFGFFKPIGGRPKLKVQTITFIPLKWVLKIKNDNEDIAEDCVGILEMVEHAKPPLNPSPDMFAGRHLMWEDKNSICLSC